jgi:hypothetical protein
LSKPVEDAVADLQTLAAAGAQACETLLMTGQSRARLSAWLAGPAQRLGRPPLIQLAWALHTRLAFPGS